MTTSMLDNSRLEELRRRVDRDPSSISFAALAEEYRRAGLLQEAVETCRAGLQRHPFYVSARVTLGRALMELGEFDEAAAVLEEALSAAPENLAAIRALAEIHKRRGELPEAIEHYQSVLAGADGQEARPEPVDTAITPASQPDDMPVEMIDAQPVVAPELARLEAFLAAIERVRRETVGQATL